MARLLCEGCSVDGAPVAVIHVPGGRQCPGCALFWPDGAKADAGVPGSASPKKKTKREAP